uniref:Glycosyltransferase 2-like domain-containing protein n=1 Tax=viral metagenome TaxID=1070528 RepID=A0A6C0HZ50_9ZZZZ
MHHFSICAVFKNESHILEEWLLHYIYRGIDHFYIVNDNSTDDFISIINRYSKYITLFNNDIETREVGRQIMVYNKYFYPILNQSKWFAILDLDEFLYSPNNIDLKHFIEKYDDFSQIRINWLHFGSNDHYYQPNSVVEGFLKRAIIDDTKPYFSYKSVFKGNSLTSFNIHSHSIKGNEIYLKYDEINIPDLIINHYSIQSQDFFLRIKSTRGDINNWFDHVKLQRNLDFFKGYDINDIYDDRLYQQNSKMISLVKYNKLHKTDDAVSIVLTSCNRPDLLKTTLESFVKYNTYPIKETIIIDDSGIQGCNDEVLKPFIEILNIKSIYNKTNIGQIQSIDKAYSYVTTKYIFHCEEDWEFLQPGFIEKSLKVFNENINEKIYTVWLRPHTCTSGHPIIYDYQNKGYYKMQPDFSYMDKGEKYTWCGFTFNPGLRRTVDCLLFHPYFKKCDKSIKNGKEYVGEYILNKKYSDAGYYAVILDDPKGHVNHIGWGQHIIREWD